MTKYVKIYNGRDNSLVGDKIRVADNFWTRFKGLMLAPDLAEGEGLIITPCNSIHMMFMRYPIDAIFIDEPIYDCYQVRMCEWDDDQIERMGGLDEAWVLIGSDQLLTDSNYNDIN